MLSGLLYFHRISDNRMAGTPLKNLRMFEELCGKNAFQNVILTTTMWDEVDEETGEERERELKTKYWRTMLDRNSTTSRFLRTRESAFDLIEPLIEAANKRSSVLLQDELVDLRKTLPATAAGQELFSAMGQIVSQREDLLRRIRHEMRQSNGDKMALEPLQEEHQRLQKSLEATVTEMRRLRLPLGKRLMIMTDKFFSSKIESLKSLITKRLSRPTALNAESPTLSIDSSVSVSNANRDKAPTGVITNDPIDNTPNTPPASGWTSQTPDYTLSSDRTTYPTRYVSSPVGQSYMNYDGSHASDNTVSTPDRTAGMHTTRHGPSSVGQAYPNYDSSYTPDNTVSPSDRTMYYTTRPSPAGQAYLNYNGSYTPDNTVSPSVPPSVGQGYPSYNRELPPRSSLYHGEYSQSHPYNRRSQNPNDGYQG